MKRNKSTIVGAFSILLAGVAGLVIPLQVFKIQEQELLWRVRMIPFITDEASNSLKKIEVKEDEYKKILHSMERGGTTYYHEPVEGQLNMGRARELSIQAINTLFGKEEFSMNSFINIKAVLQSKEENYETKPQYSYWNIQMTNENETIHIWMNSVTGIILKMDMDFYQISDIKKVDLDAFLDSYISYTGFHVDNDKKEFSNIYKTAYDKIYFGKKFDFSAAKYQCTSPEKLDKQYIKVIICIQEKEQ